MSLSWESGGIFHKIDGESIESMTLTRQANGPEEMQITFRQGIDSANLWLVRQRVSFWQDGHVFFTGRVERGPTGRTADADERSFVVRGPWEQFQERSLFGLWKDSGGGQSQAPGTFTIVDGAKPQTLGHWVRFLVGQVHGLCVEEGITQAFENYDFLGQYEIPYQTPLEQLGTMAFSDAITRALRWVPDSCLWFRHYDLTVPWIHVDRAHRRATFNALLGVEYPTGGWSEAPDVSPSSFSPEGVVIVWRQAVEVDGEDTQTAYVVEKWPETAKIGGFRVLVLDGDIEDGEEEPAGGFVLAEVLYQSLRQFAYRGSLRWDGTPRVDIDPGTRLNIGGGRDEWANMLAFVDTVQHDFMANTTTLSFGPPASLGFDDFRELLRLWRQRKVVPEDAILSQTEGGATFGMGGEGPERAAGMKPQVVYFNVNGVMASRKVLMSGALEA